MKAIICSNNGSPDVIQYQELEKPAPGDNEVLLKIRAASANPVDGFPMLVARLSRLTLGLYKPKPARLGTDVAGEVEAVGKDVTGFKPGDAVFGVCNGAFAEFACAKEKNLVLKPAGLSFEQAAAVPVAAITALQALRDKGGMQPGGLRPGQKVLIDGASGGVGSFALQVARAFGAEVTAVTSPRNLDTARSLGADQVIDYTRDNFTKSGQHYDLIVAANAHHSIFAYRRALTPGGTCVMSGGGYGQIVEVLALSRILSRMGRKKTVFFTAQIKKQDLLLLSDLLESGKIVPVIDRSYPLRDTAEALRYRNAGHARGKVIITI